MITFKLKKLIKILNLLTLNLRGEEAGFCLFAFDIRYQEVFPTAQLNEIEFIFSANFPAGVNGHAIIVLTIELISIGSDGQRHFNLK